MFGFLKAQAPWLVTNDIAAGLGELLGAVDGQYTEARLVYQEVTGTFTLDCLLVDEHGTMPLILPARYNDLFADLFFDLREATYNASQGAWFSVTLVLAAPTGSYEVSYDFDTRPWFDTALPPEFYRADVERFPRTPEATPAWLAEYVAAAHDAEAAAVVQIKTQLADFFRHDVDAVRLAYQPDDPGRDLHLAITVPGEGGERLLPVVEDDEVYRAFFQDLRAATDAAGKPAWASAEILYHCASGEHEVRYLPGTAAGSVARP